MTQKPLTKEKLEEIRTRLLSTPRPTKMMRPAIWPYYAAAAQAVEEWRQKQPTDPFPESSPHPFL